MFSTGDRAAALLADLDALRDLPAVPFEACEHVPGQVSSTALVRYRLVDYSAPAVHAHKKVTVKGYVDRVVIALGAEIVARHRRSYVRGDVVYDPLHYLSLLERKPGALDQAAPLREWDSESTLSYCNQLTFPSPISPAPHPAQHSQPKHSGPRRPSPHHITMMPGTRDGDARLDRSE